MLWKDRRGVATKPARTRADFADTLEAWGGGRRPEDSAGTDMAGEALQVEMVSGDRWRSACRASAAAAGATSRMNR
jgi:hypothetical protein